MNNRTDKLKLANKAFDKWHKLRRHIDREHARLAWDAGREFEWMCAAPVTPAPQAAAGEVPDELRRIGELLRTQDNRYTEAPLFVVEQKTPIVSDGDYNDCRVEWRETENGDYQLASPERAERLEALYQAGRETEGWRRLEVTDVWEFVTACFTEQGCKDYLAINGHNLREARIYAYGSYRNNEFRAVRNWLMSTPAAAPVKERATAGELHEAIMNLPCVVPRNAWEFSYKQGHRDARHAAAEMVAAAPSAASSDARDAALEEAARICERLRDDLTNARFTGTTAIGVKACIDAIRAAMSAPAAGEAS